MSDSKSDSDTLISRAMSLIAKRRMAKMTREKRQQIAGKGGKAWWDSLSEEERRKVIERIQKGRRKQRAEKKKLGKTAQQAESKPKTRADVGRSARPSK